MDQVMDYFCGVYASRERKKTLLSGNDVRKLKSQHKMNGAVKPKQHGSQCCLYMCVDKKAIKPIAA